MYYYIKINIFIPMWIWSFSHVSRTSPFSRKCHSSAMSPGWTGADKQECDRNFPHIPTVGLGSPPVSKAIWGWESHGRFVSALTADRRTHLINWDYLITPLLNLAYKSSGEGATLDVDVQISWAKCSKLSTGLFSWSRALVLRSLKEHNKGI